MNQDMLRHLFQKVIVQGEGKCFADAVDGKAAVGDAPAIKSLKDTIEKYVEDELKKKLAAENFRRQRNVGFPGRLGGFCRCQSGFSIICISFLDPTDDRFVGGTNYFNCRSLG